MILWIHYVNLDGFELEVLALVLGDGGERGYCGGAGAVVLGDGGERGYCGGAGAVLDGMKILLNNLDD